MTIPFALAFIVGWAVVSHMIELHQRRGSTQAGR